jgi:hypothetical protein
MTTISPMLFAACALEYEPHGVLNAHMSADLRSSFIERHTFTETSEIVVRPEALAIISHAIFRCDGDFDVRFDLISADEDATVKVISKIDGKSIPGTNLTRIDINCTLSVFHENKMTVECLDGKPVEMLFVRTLLKKEMRMIRELRPRVSLHAGSAPPHPRFSFTDFPAGKYTFGKDCSYHVCEEIEVDRRLKNVTISVNALKVTFDEVALDLLREGDSNISVLPALLFPARIDELILTLDDGSVTDETPVRELMQQKAVVSYK